MNILVLGDVVSESGCVYVRKHLPSLKRLYGVDLCLANAENSAKGNGVTPDSARHLFSSGVDALTLGNHAFRRKEVYAFLDETEAIVRPFNYPKGAPGHGVCVLDLGRVRVAVINLMGTTYMDALDNPFENSLGKIMRPGDPTCRVGAQIWNCRCGMIADLAHTHVQTSDAQVLPGGPGYITDLGMCGVKQSILGVKKEPVLSLFRSRLPVRFDTAEEGDCVLEGCLFDIDEKDGHCRSAQALRVE